MKNLVSAWLAWQDNHVDLAPAIEPLLLLWVHYQKQRYYQDYLGKDLLQDYLLTKSCCGIGKSKGKIIYIAYSSYFRAITRLIK